MTTTRTDRTQRPFVMDEGIALLARTPGTRDAMLRGLPGGWINANGVTRGVRSTSSDAIHGERTDWIPASNHSEHGEDRAFDTFDRFANRRVGGRPLSSLLESSRRCARRNLRGLTTLRLDADLDLRAHVRRRDAQLLAMGGTRSRSHRQICVLAGV